METLERSDIQSLAQKLGDTPHVSPLLHRLSRISGCGEDHIGDWLLKCAIRRGAAHYEREFSEDIPSDRPELCNEEIGVALCLGQHPYNSAFIRAAAQLLSSPHTDAPRLVRLAIMERVEPVLLHIAAIAARFAPGAHPWQYLLERLPSRLSSPPDALPHWSRFVSQTGITSSSGGSDIKWLCRRESV